MKRDFEVSFGGLKAAVKVPEGKNLSEALTLGNSPILFGCRTGICGTCLSRVSVKSGTLPPPDQDENDTLELLCPNDPTARLACRIRLSADIEIAPIKLSV